MSLQWTTIDDRFNAPSLENPLNGTAVQEETRPITVHSWSVGVQRELPWRLLADVAYVGDTTRNAFAVNAGQSYTNQLNDPDPRLLANPTPYMIDRTTGNVLPTNLIRPNYPGRGAVTQRVFLDELYRNYNAIQFEVRRRLSQRFRLGRELYRFGHQAVHGLRLVSNAGGERSPEPAQERQPAAQREDHLQLDDPGTSRSLGNNPVAKGGARRLAAVGDHDSAGRHLGELRLQLLRCGAQRHDVDRRPRRLARDHRVRSEPAAKRADVRSAVQDRVRPAARTADRPGRHALSGHRRWRRAGRCTHGPGLHQPRHDPDEELQYRRRTHTCRYAPRRTTCSTPRSIRA